MLLPCITVRLGVCVVLMVPPLKMIKGSLWKERWNENHGNERTMQTFVSSKTTSVLEAFQMHINLPSLSLAPVLL